MNNSDGSLAFQFVATFTQGGGTELNITNLTYTHSVLCSLPDDFPAAGSSTVTGSSNGWVTGTFTMSQILTNVGGTDLNLQGKASNGTITGNGP